jgi:hypothetical protein
MDVTEFLKTLESSALAERIRESLYLFPFIEAFHVFFLTMVFGTIAIIDLRLLGFAWTRRPFSRIKADVLKWTWGAFICAVITGSLMFITNADVYVHNFYFRSKMALLVLAGINMLIFELTAGRSVHDWDKNPSAPRAAKAAAALSLAMWIAIIFCGRWIGFTTTRGQSKPDSDINLEDLFPK